jgi:hypothetical protein
VTYGPVTCFMVEPTGRAKWRLRRFTFSADKRCANRGKWRHDAESEWLGECPAAIAPFGDEGRLIFHVEHPKPPHDDPRWPSHCDCGYAFTEADEWQVWTEIIYRAADGREMTLRDGVPGMMWNAMWMKRNNAPPEEIYLCVVLPCGHEWYIDGPASNGPGWTRTGTPPKVTATPSIGCGQGNSCYHGWLRNGIISSV